MSIVLTLAPHRPRGHVKARERHQPPDPTRSTKVVTRLLAGMAIGGARVLKVGTSVGVMLALVVGDATATRPRPTGSSRDARSRSKL